MSAPYPSNPNTNTNTNPNQVDSEKVQEYTVGTWDFVSPKAVTEEYMESVYQCVSSI